MTKTYEMCEQLMQEWIRNQNELTKEQCSLISQYTEDNPSSAAVLYKSLEALKNGNDNFSDMLTGLSLCKDKTNYIVSYKKCSSAFSKKQLTSLFCAAADIYCNVLPLGSVIRLRRDKNDNTAETENQMIIIDRRYVYPDENSKAFYTYSGTLFPFGSFNDCIRFNFTPNAVADIVFKGYSDETDDAYIFKAKDEMILKLKMHSFTGASEEEEEDFRNKCNGE